MAVKVKGTLIAGLSAADADRAGVLFQRQIGRRRQLHRDRGRGPGASEGMVAGDASDRYEVLGR